jgi:quercetin dioxygenase-like cupin family protein
MQSVRMPILFCLILFCPNHHPTASADTANQPTNAAKPTPLILEKNDGERREWTVVEGFVGPPMEGFIIKIDPQNGGSKHLVFITEDLEPGGKIDMHRHPESDEILFLQNGTARVNLADSSKEVHGGATVFIPANTWISMTNIGRESIHLVGVFSAPGFEEYMRAESVREGEKNMPLSKAEDEAIMRKHAHAVIYK